MAEQEYVPDLQDILLEEAHQLGGIAYVEELQYEATEYVDDEYPWDGTGDEPPERHSAWLAYLWQAIDSVRSDR